MVKRATIVDLAKASGVSVATVNRVLSGAASVRGDTAARVRDAADEIGFYAAGLIRSNLSPANPSPIGAPCEVGFLLQRPDHPFYSDFARRLGAAVTGTGLFRGKASFDYWREQDPEEIAERLLRLGRRVQALALVSPDHPTVADAVAAVRARGVPVFALLSDCAASARNAYIGVDNRKAGRMAGWALANCAPGPGRIAVFIGSHRFDGHELREIGLRAYLREHAPQFSALDPVVNGESADATAAALAELIAAHPDLVGCYLAGGGSEGALAVAGRLCAEGRFAILCNDSAVAARAALAARTLTMTISEPLDRICDALVAQTAAALADPAAAIPGQIVLPFELHTPESV